MRAWMPLAAVLALLLTAPARAQSPKVDVQVVDYAGLKQAIVANRGKVVLVDFWFQFCGPCVQGLPHLADLQRKHASEGLVVITVNTDPPASRKQVLAILENAGASFTNLLLNEPAELLEHKLRIKSFPSYYLFDRQGKWIQVTSDERDIDDAAVDRLLVQLLRE
jgi:thiol-disulfide isomerase/thioredoxin